MYKNNKRGFTFVELIVVITIMAILATIGFGTYQTYLSGGRDTNRLVQLGDIHDGFERYSVNSRLPFPEDMIEVQASGDTFAYQGYAGEGVIKAIGYDGGGQDVEYGTYLTYMLSENQRSFQLMTYIDDAELLGKNYISNTYANQDYTRMFSKVLGSPLGVLVDEATRAPIQEISSIGDIGTYDVLTGTGNMISYFTDTEKIFSSKGQDMTKMLPDKSCTRIVELGRSKGNGKYVINPTGTTKIQVYCDMETDGGGWTFVGYLSPTVSRSDLNFQTGVGNYDVEKKSSPQSYLLEMGSFNHTEMLLLINTDNVQLADDGAHLIMLKYGTDADMFHTADVNSCPNRVGKEDGIFHRAGTSGKYEFTTDAHCSTDWYTRQLTGLRSRYFRVRDSSNGVGGDLFEDYWGNDAYIYIR